MKTYIVPPNTDIIEQGCKALLRFPAVWDIMSEEERCVLRRFAIKWQKRIDEAITAEVEHD